MIESIDEKILIELKNFNFKRNSLAYEYLIDAIKIIVNDRRTIKDFSKYVYGQIAEKYDTRPQNVLWCINKLINLMYFNTDSKVIGKYFNINKNDKLSTKAFIIGIARKIESERSILSYI